MLLKFEPETCGNQWRISLMTCFVLMTGVVLILNYVPVVLRELLLATIMLYLLLWGLSACVYKCNGLDRKRQISLLPAYEAADPLRQFALYFLAVFLVCSVVHWALTGLILRSDFDGDYFRPAFFYREFAGGISHVKLIHAIASLFIVAIVARFLLRQYSGYARFTRRSCLETSMIVACLGSVFVILPWRGII